MATLSVTKISENVFVYRKDCYLKWYTANVRLNVKIEYDNKLSELILPYYYCGFVGPISDENLFKPPLPNAGYLLPVAATFGSYQIALEEVQDQNPKQAVYTVAIR
jgi:hypothetical protein